MGRILLGYCRERSIKDIVPCEKKSRILRDIHDSLSKHGIEVERVFPQNLKEHLWVRDNFFVLENTCILCSLTRSDTIDKDRTVEENGIRDFILRKNHDIFRLPDDVAIEGGDVITSGNVVFVGLGERTSREAVQHLRSRFKSFEFYTVRHDDLHLDCCFAALDGAIMYHRTRTHADDIETIARRFPNRRLIDLDWNVEESRRRLNTNFIVHRDKVFHGKLSTYMKDLFRSLHYEVVEIPSVNDVYPEGGGIRCLTQWLPDAASAKTHSDR